MGKDNKVHFTVREIQNEERLIKDHKKCLLNQDDKCLPFISEMIKSTWEGALSGPVS